MVASKAQVLRFIAESPSKVNFGGLKRHFYETHRQDPAKLKQLVASLVQTGHLCYTSHYGDSFIEISYDHPRAISDHVIIKPPRCSYTALPGQWVISLGRGASFGGGDHPTTRLAIQLIDDLLHLPFWRNRRKPARAIDVGTGSGILAIVAAKLGLGLVLGTDCDPCAVFEARENVRLNQIEDRVKILDDDLSAITGSYEFIIANLRMPTLFDLLPALEKIVANESLLVFSGLKSEEVTPICDFYEEAGFFLHQKRSEKGWSAIGLVRNDFLNEGAVPMEGY